MLISDHIKNSLDLFPTAPYSLLPAPKLRTRPAWPTASAPCSLSPSILCLHLK
ncbi:MAG: hypothetical protein F6J98_16225 [Moorea sp. SIO4G2]|uniref:hypothetical protein n=1 Tax=Moorena TaxID=1155738 RepID=UPI0013014B2B|nr:MULTISPECIES: hypothetical protein [Moorena]NEO12072.1 hypothetical protein [Moorena sp. SIO3E8]NEO61893.1 hypothetical protein [Moorena sp. SIO4G2]NEP98187.1 hypothetical protein [Moorena sp. SIO3F7]